MTVADTIKKSYFTYPTLYNGNYDDIKFSVLHKYFITINGGIEWAKTKVPKNAGYLTEPIYYNRKRVYDLPYGEKKVEGNIEDYLPPNKAYVLKKIDHKKTEEYQNKFGKYFKNELDLTQEVIDYDDISRRLYIEKDFSLLPEKTLMPGDKYNKKYTHHLKEINITKNRVFERNNPYPNFSKKYSCFWEPGVEYIKDDWRTEAILHLEHWQIYFNDNERLKEYIDYPKKNDEIIGILKTQIKNSNSPTSVFNNYGYKPFDLNDPIAFEIATHQRWEKNREDTISFINQTIEKLKNI